MAVLLVLQVRLSCLLWGAEAVEVFAVAGCCGALSLVPALVWMHPLEACTAPVRPDEKVLLHFERRCPFLLQLLWMLLLLVLQVELGCLLRGAEDAEVVVVAGRCVAFSLVPALVWIHSLETCLGLVRSDEKVLLHWKQHWAWHLLLLQLFWMLLLVVLQVRLGSILWGAEDAEVVVVAG